MTGSGNKFKPIFFPQPEQEMTCIFHMNPQCTTPEDKKAQAVSYISVYGLHFYSIYDRRLCLVRTVVP